MRLKINNNRAKRVRFVALAISLLIAHSVTVRAEAPIEAMKAATVRVVCKSSFGLGSGSGVIIGNGDHVVTNNHVIECADSGGEVIVIQSKEQRHPATVIWKSEEKDLAVLRLQGSIDGTVPSFATSSMVKDAQTVYAMGFPGAADSSRESLFQVKITKGIISSRTTVEGLKVYQTDAAINSGNSGGPLFNEAGQVVGINFAKKAAVGIEGIGWAIQADELLTELDRLNIPYRTSNIFGQPVAPKPVAPSPNQKREPQAPFDSRQTSELPILYFVIGIAIALSGVAIFLTTTSRGKDIARRSHDVMTGRYTANNIPREIPQPTGTHPVIFGIAGTFAGKEFRLGMETISFGRDPKQCQVVFPADLKDIGRVHCTLSYDRSRRAFILLDKGSTNGTFLGKGERLNPGAESQILHGGRFYLASPSNMFEVRLV